jgi:hypothetical protein
MSLTARSSSAAGTQNSRSNRVRFPWKEHTRRSRACRTRMGRTRGKFGYNDPRCRSTRLATSHLLCNTNHSALMVLLGRGGVGLNPFVLRSHIGLLYQPRLIGWSTGRGKQKYSEEKMSNATLSITNSTWTALGLYPSLRSEKPATKPHEKWHGSWIGSLTFSWQTYTCIISLAVSYDMK